MNLEFFVHVMIMSTIFFVISTGFKFFLKIKSTLDLSYMAIIIFSTYVWFYLNINFEFGIIFSVIASFLFSIPITFLVLFLSSRLDDIYFIIWTFSIYLIFVEFARNFESITWGVFWISLRTQKVFGEYIISGIGDFFIFSFIVSLCVIIVLFFIRKSFFYTILLWWWENSLSLKSLWVKTNIYRFSMILLTTLLAALWWNLYGFYFMYIDPSSFWLIMLDTIIIITFLSYRFNNLVTLLVSFLVISLNEFLRFFKFVDASKMWYFREIIFSLFVIFISFYVFKYTKFWREI